MIRRTSYANIRRAKNKKYGIRIATPSLVTLRKSATTDALHWGHHLPDQESISMKIIQFTLCVALALISFVASAQDTSFTYQGELKDNGSPAGGVYNFGFSLFDSETGGSQIGTTELLTGWPVVDGKFTVQLDFGALAFDNSERGLRSRSTASHFRPQCDHPGTLCNSDSWDLRRSFRQCGHRIHRFPGGSATARS